MKINKKQKVIQYIVIGVIVLMFLFPPLYFKHEGVISNCGHHFIIDWSYRINLGDNSYDLGNRRYDDGWDGQCRIDIPTLLFQWGGVLFIGGLAFFVARGGRKE